MEVNDLSQLEKLLERIKNSPQTVRFSEIEKILIKNGFIDRTPRGGSSHHTFKHPDGRRITIPHREPYILAVYIKQAIKLLGEE